MTVPDTGGAAGAAGAKGGSGGAAGTGSVETEGGAGAADTGAGGALDTGGTPNGAGGSRAGAASGGAPAGGTLGDAGEPSAEAGSGGSGVRSPFMLGADISSVPEAEDAGAIYTDTDGVDKDLLEILKNHGFNYVRLRAFVDPTALYGYANPTGEARYQKAESYCDTAHTLELAQRIKAAGMGFLLDLHYSDNWADPGKQVIPAAWRGASSIAELADEVESYTRDVVRTLADGGARPDMVQIGNEITPGLLIHVPAANPDPDQWGNMNKRVNAVNGSASDFNNVAKLLTAGVDGVKSVDPSIKIMLHLENTRSFPAVRDWVKAVRARGVYPDVLGLSCYTAYQGQPAVWQDTFEQLTRAFDDISFVIAEYNAERTQANQIMYDLPDGRGLGTFFWEPTQSGSWGSALFSFDGDSYQADPTAFEEFDALKISLGL